LKEVYYFPVTRIIIDIDRPINLETGMNEIKKKKKKKNESINILYHIFCYIRYQFLPILLISKYKYWTVISDEFINISIFFFNLFKIHNE